MFGKTLFTFVSVLFVGLIPVEASAQQKKEILFVSDGSRVASMMGPAGSFEGTCEIVNQRFSDCNYLQYLEGKEEVARFIEELRNNGVSVDITVDDRIHGAHVTQVAPESFARVTGNSSFGSSDNSSDELPEREVPTTSSATGGSQSQQTRRSSTTSGSGNSGGSGNTGGSSQLPRPSQVEWLGGNRNSSTLPDLLIFHDANGETHYFMAESGYSDHVQMVSEETGIPAEEIAWVEGQSIWKQSNDYGYKATLRQKSSN